MLSTNDDPKLVRKGIEHGACDYLLKPVRLEELKNIWQHVIRKKKVCKEQKHSDNKTSEDGQGNSSKISHTQKRKEQDDEDKEEEDEETTNENEPVSKKKRVVWTKELHSRFMKAIDVLGANGAVPKRMLEIMDAEGLSRENVASHLQKYRLCLRKMEEKARMGIAQDNIQVFSPSPSLQFYPQNTTFNNNQGMLIQNNNNARGLVPYARPSHMLGSRFHHGNIIQQRPSTFQQTPLLLTNSPYNGLPLSARQTHVNGNISMPSNSNMIQSIGAPNLLPMNSMLYPNVTQSNSNHMNFSSRGLLSHPNISSNNNNITFDPMLMLSVANVGSNYLNFGTRRDTSQCNNTANVTFGSHYDNQPLVDSYSSHIQRLNSGSNRVVRMNANGHSGNYNNMARAQPNRIENLIPDNPFNNGDHVSLGNAYLNDEGDYSSGIFDELENLLIKPEEVVDSWLSEMEQDLHS